jgi:hypothetical protein
VLRHFPTALGVDDFMARVETILSGYGFTGDNSIGGRFRFKAAQGERVRMWVDTVMTPALPATACRNSPFTPVPLTHAQPHGMTNVCLMCMCSHDKCACCASAVLTNVCLLNMCSHDKFMSGRSDVDIEGQD